MWRLTRVLCRGAQGCSRVCCFVELWAWCAGPMQVAAGVQQG